ncbi:NADH-quinone oxidoreductase subunit A [Chloroflexota bacterium]
MLDNYGYVALFIISAILFSLVFVVIPIILRLLKVSRNNPNPIKNLNFECGMETTGKTWIQFNFRYYFYALLFLAIDVLVVFLLPWAANLRELGLSGFIPVLILIFIVIVGYLYAWRKKVLEWK